MTKPEIFQVATTTGNRDEAERIAVTLVERKLAACVQISGPVSSIYHLSLAEKCRTLTGVNLYRQNNPNSL